MSRQAAFAILILNLFFTAPVPSAQVRQTEVPLTNSGVIQMLKAGLSDDLIIDKIKASETEFSLSTDDLVVLKAAGLPDKILSAMLERQKAKPIQTDEGHASIPGAPRLATQSVAPQHERAKDLGPVVSFSAQSQVVWVFLEDVTSFNKTQGQDFWLQVYTAAQTSGDQLPTGTRLHGLITGASKAGRFYRVGDLRFYFSEIVFADGRAIPLSPDEFDWQFGKLKKVKPKGPKIDSTKRLTEGNATVGFLGYWSFKNSKITKNPKDRIAVDQIDGATSAQGASLKMGKLAGATTGSLAGMFAKMPDAGGYAGTGIVLQFANLKVPRG